MKTAWGGAGGRAGAIKASTTKLRGCCDGVLNSSSAKAEELSEEEISTSEGGGSVGETL